MLLSLMSKEDKHHTETVRFLDGFPEGLRLSPYSLVELDLLLRSGEIAVRETKTFYTSLGTFLDYRDVDLVPAKPVYHGAAHTLRERYKGITYFDSLHAAVGIIEDMELISYDKGYASVAGLKYRPPSRRLSRSK